MEFPRLVYKSASNHKLVKTPDEYSAAIQQGWFGSVPEALNGKAVAPAAPVVKTPEVLTDPAAPAAPAPAAPVLTKKQQKAAAAAAAAATPPAPAAPADPVTPAAPVKQPWD